MLILAAFATFFSIWNAVYVPSMKASAEVEHLENVESSFVHFSSDIDYAISSHQDSLVFSEPVQLGGGDVMENPIKSAGTLTVQNETDPIAELIISDNQGNPLALVNATIVNVSYEPVDNFWQDQGYRWQYGYINITKDGELSTPLEYYNMTDVGNQINSSGSLQSLAKSFIGISETTNTTPLQSANGGYTILNGNCSALDLWIVTVNMSAIHPFVSSNGVGTLEITTTASSTPYYNVAYISLGSNNAIFGNITMGNWNTSLGAVSATCQNNVAFDSSSTWDYSRWDINQATSPVNVTLHQESVVVSAS